MPKTSILRIGETHTDTSSYVFNDYNGAILPVTITVCPVEQSFLPQLLRFRLHLGIRSWRRRVLPTPSFNGHKLHMGRRRCSWDHNYFHDDRRPGTLRRVL